MIDIFRREESLMIYKLRNGYTCIQKAELTSGGYGSIYDCDIYDLTNTLVEDKFVLKKILSRHEHKLEMPHRFDREMRYMEQMSHDNILKPYYCDYDNQFIIMKKYRYNLRTYICEKVVNIDEKLSIFNKILNAVDYYLSEDIIHRDIKPENILISDNGNPYITDFGISSRLTRDATMFNLTKTSTEAFTYFYSAPEQIINPRNASVKSEIFSLGRLLHVMITESFDSPVSLDGLVNDDLKYIIRKCTKYNPDERFNNISELKNNIILLNQEYISDIDRMSLLKLIDSSDLNYSNFKIINKSLIESDLLFVMMTSEQHIKLMNIDDNQYYEFVDEVIKAFNNNYYEFSYVENIINSNIRLFNKINDFDLEKKIELIDSMVSVSTRHNRFAAMRNIGEYISEIKSSISLNLFVKLIKTNKNSSSYVTINEYYLIPNIMSRITDL